jgi:hypothetical protein
MNNEIHFLLSYIYTFHKFYFVLEYIIFSSKFAYSTEQYISHRKSPDIYDVAIFIVHLQFKLKRTFISRDLTVSIQAS